MWSWVLEGVGLIGATLAGRKLWQGWLVLLCNAVLWTIYGFTSKQYGFCFASVFYAIVYSRNLTKWRKIPDENRTNLGTINPSHYDMTPWLKPRSEFHPEPKCDHIEGGEIPHTTEGINVWLWFIYCPKCGKEL